MNWEQDPWSVPGGVQPPRYGRTGGGRRSGSGGRGANVGVRWWWILVLCGAGYAGWSLVYGDHGIVRLRKLAMREAELKAEIAETQAGVKDLENEAAHIDKTIEDRAREIYHMGRADEIDYIVESADSGSGQVVPRVAPGQPPTSSPGPVTSAPPSSRSRTASPSRGPTADRGSRHGAR